MKKFFMIGLALLSSLALHAETEKRIQKAEQSCPVSNGDEDIFQTFFCGEKQNRKPQWDSQHLALYSSGWAVAKTGRKVFIENIEKLSEDGAILTTLTRTWEQSLEGYYDEVSTKTAIVPYVFMSTLTLVVDRSDERIEFRIWDYDASSRQLKKIILKSYNVHTVKKLSECVLWSVNAEETQKGSRHTPTP